MRQYIRSLEKEFEGNNVSVFLLSSFFIMNLAWVCPLRNQILFSSYYIQKIFFIISPFHVSRLNRGLSSCDPDLRDPGAHSRGSPDGKMVPLEKGKYIVHTKV